MAWNDPQPDEEWAWTAYMGMGIIIALVFTALIFLIVAAQNNNGNEEKQQEGSQEALKAGEGLQDF